MMMTRVMQVIMQVNHLPKDTIKPDQNQVTETLGPAGVEKLHTVYFFSEGFPWLCSIPRSGTWKEQTENR